MFDLEKFKTGEYYVHLPTQELYDEVMDFLDKNGFVWGGSRDSLDSEHYWSKYKADTAINREINNGIRYGSEQNYISEGYKKLELNEREENMEEKLRALFEKAFEHRINYLEHYNMESKIRRDLIKALFELEFGTRIDYIEQYKGRLVSHDSFVTVQIIDFIDRLNKEYDIKGDEVAKVVIESFDVKEYEL